MGFVFAQSRTDEEYGVAAREVEEMFADILERVKALDPGNARKWFENLRAESLDGGALVVGCVSIRLVGNFILVSFRATMVAAL